MINPMTARTIRSDENNYRKTYLNQVKKIFRTITGILSYLKAKMQYNTRKHQTPIKFTGLFQGQLFIVECHIY